MTRQRQTHKLAQGNKVNGRRRLLDEGRGFGDYFGYEGATKSGGKSIIDRETGGEFDREMT